MYKKKSSLRRGLLAAIVVCWIAAVLIVISIAGALINRNFNETLQERVDNDAESILDQLSFRLTDTMESSKKVSYDGVVRNAYLQYINDQNNIELYRAVTQYLSSTFSRDAKYEAVFISFWKPEITSRVYLINQKNNSYQILQHFITDMRPVILEEMKEADTAIRFLVMDNELYMCRNLLDSHFDPYATVTMRCDTAVLFQPLQSLAALGETMISIDETKFLLHENGELNSISADETIQEETMQYAQKVDGHSIAFYVTRETFDIWTDMPGLSPALVIAFALVLPILALMILLYYFRVSKPINILLDAVHKVQSGERGYQITETATTLEFESLFTNFNHMSSMLKAQFEQSKLEQQVLQDAQIKALQSQINPHFLNNTLEVINWEARMAGNDQVSEMIDALSTMLEAALNRDGIGTVPLYREMEYVDAYLYIIARRLGSRFVVTRNLDENLMQVHVPKLILQPIVENAVQHDITPKKGGHLEVRTMKDDRNLILEVEHEGNLTEEDLERIREELDPNQAKEPASGKRRHVGIRNVAMRLKILYGSTCCLTIEQTKPGIICARVRLPLDPS